MNQIIGKHCEVTDNFLVKTRKRQSTKTGVIVGCYTNEVWHPYVYRAFHIEFNDGTKNTYKAQDVKLHE